MKWFEIRIVVAVVFGLLMLSGLNAPPAHADFTFGEPEVVDWAIPIFDSSRHWDGWQCFSYDGLEMYITSAVLPGGYGGFDLWVLKRASVEDEWGPPQNLGPEINSPVEDSLASISADGLTLYFCSQRTGGHGDMDMYMTTRPTKDDPWGPAVNLGPPVNSPGNEGSPWISPDGLELYFSSDRPGGSGLADIYVSRRPTTSDPWGEPVNLGPGVNSPAHESWPSLSPDGLLLLFNDHPRGAPRPGGYGGLDIWMTRRASLSDPWQDAVNAGPMVNSPATDVLPRIWPDGRTLYFWRHGQGLLAAPILPIVDFNGDGIVDLVDLMMLIEHWGTDNPLYDIGPMSWGDGIVDEADLEVLMSYWGQAVHYPCRQAHRPTPTDQGIVDVEHSRSLNWWPGSSATEHDVYVGTNAAAVENADTSDTTGVYRGRQQAREYTLPEELLPDQTYYWRIDQWNTNATLTRGEVWSFFVADYLIVDDFESYDDAEEGKGTRIYEVWIDGWENETGSEVGYSEALGGTFGERTIVHGGRQSMPLFYDNTEATYSEAKRTFAAPQDWTRRGVETLNLWIYGSPDNAAEPLYVSLGDSADNTAVVAHPDPAATTVDAWQQWSIPLADFAGLDLTAVTSMAIVLGDADRTEPGGLGVLFIDDIYLHPVSTQGQ
jgi:hypothetical protein